MTLYVTHNDRIAMRGNKTLQDSFKALQRAYKDFRNAQDMFENIRVLWHSKNNDFKVYNSGVMDLKSYCLKHNIECYQPENSLTEIDIIHRFTNRGKIYKFNISNLDGHGTDRLTIRVTKLDCIDLNNIIVNRIETIGKKSIRWKEIRSGSLQEQHVFESKLTAEEIYFILNAIRQMKSATILESFESFKKKFFNQN